ncbi:uncharacterized protein LOC120331671 [Styela clava]
MMTPIAIFYIFVIAWITSASTLPVQGGDCNDQIGLAVDLRTSFKNWYDAKDECEKNGTILMPFPLSNAWNQSHLNSATMQCKNFTLFVGERNGSECLTIRRDTSDKYIKEWVSCYNEEYFLCIVNEASPNITDTTTDSAVTSTTTESTTSATKGSQSGLGLLIQPALLYLLLKW